MKVAALEKRILALERACLERGKSCNCRTGGQTTYHGAKELGNLMQISCPAHGFRDLGRLRWLPSGLPLQPGDQEFCLCPPSPMREFLLGRRGPLSAVEQQEQQERWERESSPDFEAEFLREKARVESLLRKYVCTTNTK